MRVKQEIQMQEEMVVPAALVRCSCGSLSSESVSTWDAGF